MKNLLNKIIIVAVFITIIATDAFAVEDYHSSYFGGVFMGQRLVNEWKIDDAYDLAKKLMAEDPKNNDNRFLMCVVLFYRGDYKESVKFIDEGNPDGKGIFSLIKTTNEQTKNFVRKESEHFILSHLPGKDDIMVEDALTALEGAYKNIGADLGFTPGSKILVEIYPDIKSFTAVSTLTKEDIETSGTIALCKFNRLMITSPRVLLRGYEWLVTLCHEYIHYAVYNLSRSNAPIWLHEGIAKYLEDRYDSDIVGRMTPTSENALSRRLKADTLVTIQQMSPSMAKLKSGEDVLVAFAEVNSMIDYMVKQKGFSAVKDILRLMSEGKSDADAVQGVFKVSLESFQKSWKSALLASGLKEIPGLEIGDMGVKIKSSEDLSEDAIESEELKDHSSKEVREFITLGNLLRDRGRFTAASYEYEKGYKEDPFSVITLTKLSLSYILINDYDKALKVLDEAKALYPDYVTILYRLGQVYMAKKDYKSSVKYFNDSIKVNPFIPEVREDLIQIYKIMKEDKLAKKQQEILDKLNGGERQGHKAP